MSPSKIDFDGRTWAAHSQDHWLDFAGNPNFPDYLRLVFVAYARHGANGHALLERGELARYLVRKDGTLPERRVLWGALQKAIRLGYLSAGSQLLCLVVSSDHAQRADGDPTIPCRRDHRVRQKTSRTKVDREHGRFVTNVGDDDRRSETNVGNGARRSELNVGHGDRRSGTNVGDDDRRSTLGPSSLSSPTAPPGADPVSQREAS